LEENLMLEMITPSEARPRAQRVPPLGNIDRAIDPALSLDQPAMLVKMALERGMFDEADEAIAGLIAEDPEEGEPYVLKGVAALLRGKNLEANDDFLAAAARGAEERITALGRTMALMGLERFTEAWAITVKLSRQHRDDPEVLHWLLRAGTALERWDAMAERLAIYLEERPEDHSARFALAGVHVRRGDLVRARSEHEILRRVVPSFHGLDALATAIASRRRGRA
jgi:O-antigen biosynthesis protein